MSVNRRKKALLIFLGFLVVFFILFTLFCRIYLDPDEYLKIAYDYTNHDPHILNWQEPEFEIIQYEGRLAVHILYHTDEDREKGPYSFYIDPFHKTVFAEDPRR